MKIKVSDYIFQFLESKNIDTAFSVSGGAAAHLLESIRKSNIKYIPNYHEQASAMSAEGYTRITNKPALVLVTNGPGSSNTLTGVVGAYQDSIPMFIISGQVPTSQTIYILNLRQLGVQELRIIPIVKGPLLIMLLK
jgi:acetolactate synthase I/II/III large subunit